MRGAGGGSSSELITCGYFGFFCLFSQDCYICRRTVFEGRGVGPVHLLWRSVVVLFGLVFSRNGTCGHDQLILLVLCGSFWFCIHKFASDILGATMD